MAVNNLDWETKMRIGIFKSTMRSLPLKIGNLAERHFKDSFRQKGFMDDSLEAWPARKNAGRGSLMIVSGALKRSIRRTNLTANSVTIVAGDGMVAYAKIHNEGGTTHPKVTDKMRAWAWANYYGASGEGLKTGKSGNVYQSINAGSKANKFKALALTKKNTLTVDLPQRKFMGQSAELDRKTIELIKRNINAVFNPINERTL